MHFVGMCFYLVTESCTVYSSHFGCSLIAQMLTDTGSPWPSSCQVRSAIVSRMRRVCFLGSLYSAESFIPPSRYFLSSKDTELTVEYEALGSMS